MAPLAIAAHGTAAQRFISCSRVIASSAQYVSISTRPPSAHTEGSPWRLVDNCATNQLVSWNSQSYPSAAASGHMILCCPPFARAAMGKSAVRAPGANTVTAHKVTDQTRSAAMRKCHPPMLHSFHNVHLHPTTPCGHAQIKTAQAGQWHA